MFGFIKKLQSGYSELASNSVKAENKDLMEAMVAGAVLVAYADGELSEAEMSKCRSFVNSTFSKKIK